MDTLIPVGWQDLLHQSMDWVQRDVLVRATLLQALSALVAIGAVWLLARPLQRWLLHEATRLSGPLYPVAAALARSAPPILLLLLLWFERLAFNAAGNRADLLRLLESLVLVWVLIRLSSRLVRDERLARTIAIVAFIIAALNIAGLIGPTFSLAMMKATM